MARMRGKAGRAEFCGAATYIRSMDGGVQETRTGSIWQSAPYVDGASPICDALPALRRKLRAHYLRLSRKSRLRRFMGPTDDRTIAALADRATPDLVLGLTLDGRTRGVLEIYCAGDDHAEIGLSLEDAYQGHGHGRRLFEAGLDYLANVGIGTADLFFARTNRRIIDLVRSAGGTVTCHGNDCEAQIDVAASHRARLARR